jgi:hypothetical protein
MLSKWSLRVNIADIIVFGKSSSKSSPSVSASAADTNSAQRFRQCTSAVRPMEGPVGEPSSRCRSLGEASSRHWNPVRILPRNFDHAFSSLLEARTSH